MAEKKQPIPVPSHECQACARGRKPIVITCPYFKMCAEKLDETED